MKDDPEAPRDGGAGPDEAARLEALRARLRAKTAPPSAAHHYGRAHNQAQMAWRMVLELVAGLLVGAAMGYGLDWLLGTSPWLLIVFTFLGFAAGIKTVISSAREMNEAFEAGAGRPQDEDR
jgi:ATP synthase protein I